MKKLLCLALVFALMIPLACSASASNKTEFAANDAPPIYTEHFTIDEIQHATIEPVEQISAGEITPSEPVTDDTVTINGEPAYVEYFTLDDICAVEPGENETPFALYVTRYFDFSNTLYNNICSDFIEYEVYQGEAVTLDVVSCSWYPHTCKLHVGIYDLETGIGYYTVAGGGNLVDTLLFADMDESNYMVYIRNISSATVTSGSIRYSIP